MYLYFDKNGVLVEMINDEALRQYNQNVNYIYVYIENSGHPESFPIGLKYLRYWFELPDGSSSLEYSTQDHKGDEVVTQIIPPNNKRDVKHFEYGVRYKMHKIRIPCGDKLENDMFEDNIFEEDGTVALTIKAIYELEELALGKVVFKVEDSVVREDHHITMSQFDYLLNAIGNAGSGGSGGGEVDGDYVPLRLSIMPSVQDTGTSFRQRASIYVDSNGSSRRMSLQQVKEMNTKILDVDNVDEADMSKLTAGDYIYSRI